VILQLENANEIKLEI